MTIKAIIFDFGDVLDYTDRMQEWLAHRDQLAADHFNLGGEAFWLQAFQSDAWQDCKRGRIDHTEFWNRVLTPLGITVSDQQAEFVRQLYQGRDHIHPEMVLLLRELKPHYKLALLSNTYEPEMDTWIATTHGLTGIFDVVVSSAKVGLAKPEPEIYQLTLERLGVTADEALFIDDRSRNTNAAEALGIRSIIFESPIQLRHELAALGILVPSRETPDQPSMTSHT